MHSASFTMPHLSPLFSGAFLPHTAALQLRPRFLSLLAMVFLLHGFFVAAAEKGELPKIFILQSYAKEDVCGTPQEEGILKALADAWYLPDRDFKLTTFYMDTRKANTTPEKMDRITAEAKQRIAAVKPDILILCDDNAFARIGLDLVDQPGLNIVYCGLNGIPAEYNRKKRFYETPQRPGHNITGVYEKLHVADAFRVHREILPNSGDILVITDRSLTGLALAKQVDLELKDLSGWQKKEAQSWEDYQSIIREAAADPRISAIYPVALQLHSNQEDKNYGVVEILNWTSQNFTKPELALNYAFCKYGLFGGAVVDFTDMGRQAGTLAVRILKGTPAGELPLEDAKRFTLVFNLAKARRIQVTIPEDILLAAEEIYNK